MLESENAQLREAVQKAESELQRREAALKDERAERAAIEQQATVEAGAHDAALMIAKAKHAAFVKEAEAVASVEVENLRKKVTRLETGAPLAAGQPLLTSMADSLASPSV